jgi:glucose-1-phosphate cytidylyltransferase
MKTVLLAGGLGTRLREETDFRPKPMVPIGNFPILWHIMKTYAHYSQTDFIVCTGYKGEVISQYFHDFSAQNLDFTVTLGSQTRPVYIGSLDESNWKVTVARTGPLTPTGGRIFKVRDHVGRDAFMCTYGDGVANIDISKLMNYHRASGKIVTLTAVQPPSRFGVIDILDSGIVEKFREKPISDTWINAGYFVFEPEIFDYLDENSILEGEPLAELAKIGQVAAFKHSGYWQPMDTFRESQLLNDLWERNVAPWKVWNS